MESGQAQRAIHSGAIHAALFMAVTSAVIFVLPHQSLSRHTIFGLLMLSLGIGALAGLKAGYDDSRNGVDQDR